MENRIELYKSSDSGIEIRVQFDKDSVWLSQKQMAELFGKDSDTIGLHLKNIFTSGELTENATAEESSVVRQEGNRYITKMP